MAYRDNWRALQQMTLALAQPRARTVAMANQATDGGPMGQGLSPGIGSLDLLTQMTQGMGSIVGGWDPDYAGYYLRVLSGGLL